ncbi:hypothetical protein AXG93_4079s1150 [Marchantia polymorpha subsp. ruderalis]|uniref:Uncharacterized protein n=1 Tax=Marchantia polymorpha subsp. ruderalis TaxID=1480154 RepID=A0A176VVX6_MARPO|nr:hypothetical protein AXG93_4079s1150 [Marchantia polymorpha subsp. ruderalis]
MSVPAADRRAARAPYADSPSGLGPLARAPSVQRRKGKEPAEDPPSAQGPSGQGPSATQNQILSEELVRQTRLLEQCQLARQADEELIRKLQSECGELRAQRADAELQLVVVEDDRRREADRTKEELVRRVNHCLRDTCEVGGVTGAYGLPPPEDVFTMYSTVKVSRATLFPMSAQFHPLALSKTTSLVT